MSHWSDPQHFPELQVAPQWGIFDAQGRHEPLALEEIIARIRKGPGREMWNGKPEHPDVVFVSRPESNRVVPALECPELQPALLERLREVLGNARRKNGLVFYPLLALTLLLEFGFGTFAILPAIFAVMTGAGHVEAWLALRKLDADPVQFLRDSAAALHYAAWIRTAGVRHWCRTCWMVGAWALVGGVQMFSPSWLETAALVKSQVAAQPWRLLTATMLHGSILHFVMNAGAMLSLGLLLERGVHRHLLSCTWLVAAIAGSLLSGVAMPGTSVGASGGILGVFAFLLVMGLRRKSQLPPDYAQSLARSLMMIAMLGILAWGTIDNAAHAGGALAGAALGAWTFRKGDGVLPLADSFALRALARVCDSLFVAIAALTIAKLLGLA